MSVVLIKLFRNCFFLVFTVIHLTVKAQDKRDHPLSDKKTNIIFILVDDQGYGDLGAFYQNQRAKAMNRNLPLEYSPNLDLLAAGGAMLTQHYCAAPVCAPSRASILLGVSQGHANVRNNQFDKALEDNYTMASTLHRLGYHTAAIGKWGLQGDEEWDDNGAEWPAQPLNRGFDYFFGYMRHRDGHEHYPKEGVYRGKKEVWKNRVNVAVGLDKCYTTDLWTAAAKKWIIDHEKGKEKHNPFFMYLAYDAPHAVLELPTTGYPDGGGLQGGIQWTGIPGQMINTASGKVDSYTHPDYAKATYDHDNNPETPELPWPETYKRYATANRRIDDAVGDLTQLLKDLRIDSTTMIVYTSDNGVSMESYLPEKFAPNEPDFFDSFGPFSGIKRDVWEGGVRVPAIAYWPGHIATGSVITTPSINYDWAPTFIDMAGQAPPASMDGVSILPALTGTGKQRKSLVYVEYYQPGKTPGYNEFASGLRNRIRNQMQLVRIGDYAGVRYNVQSAHDNFEIYNVVTDPRQEKNLMLHPDKKAPIKKQKSLNRNIFGKTSIRELQAFMQARVLQVRRPDSTAQRPYDNALISSVSEKTVPGVNWKIYKGSFPWLPQVDDLKPLQSGNTAYPDVAISTDNNEILYYEGYIRVPEDGEYIFSLVSDARILLRIHDARVIDADGYKRDRPLETSILLKAGLHPFRLYYERLKENEPLLKLEWSGPGISRQAIVKEFFFRNRKKDSN